MFGKKSSRKDEFANLGLTVPDMKELGIGESDGDLEKELMELLKNDGDADGIQLDSDEGDNEEDLLAELEAFCSDDKPAPEPPSNKQPEKRPTSSLTPNHLSVQQIQERRASYESAINALLDSSSPDGSKLETWTEAVDKLNNLESRIKKGEIIRIDQLPPEPDLASKSTPPKQPIPSVTTNTPTPKAQTQTQPEPSRTDKSEPKPDGRQMVLDFVNPQVSQDSGMMALKKRLQEYKMAALQARNDGQIERGKQLLMASKCISEAIQKIETGEETFDPSTDMPPPPSEFEVASDEAEEEPEPNASQQELTKQFAAMATPIVSVDNLTQRMAYFQNMVAELQKDSSADAKRRRMGRIVKQYEEALVACKRGVSTYTYSALPTPPGCPELTDLSQLAPAASHQPGAAAAAGTTAASATTASSSKPGSTAKPDAVALLTKRQTELKIAAAQAKQAGNIEQAKRYLISARGMAPMIQAAAAGMPINKSQIPPPPHVTSPGDSLSFTVFTGQKCDPPAEYIELMEAKTSGKILLKILEAQEKEACELLSQHQKSGERKFVTNLYELAKFADRDKKYVTQGIKCTFSFELVNLPRLNMNIDLGDDILEVASVRGIDLPLPSGVSSPEHLDTYVELQLSYPSSSEPTKLASEWAKHSNQPVYIFQNSRFPVNFKTRLYRQIVQSNRGLRATIYYKRGLLKSNGIVGTVVIPLSGLVNAATITHVGNVMAGFRAAGGQLEIKLRQRTSLLGESVTYIQKPWLRLSASNPDTQRIPASSSSSTAAAGAASVTTLSPNSRLSPKSKIEIVRPPPHSADSASRLPRYQVTDRHAR